MCSRCSRSSGNGGNSSKRWRMGSRRRSCVCPHNHHQHHPQSILSSPSSAQSSPSSKTSSSPSSAASSSSSSASSSSSTSSSSSLPSSSSSSPAISSSSSLLQSQRPAADAMPGRRVAAREALATWVLGSRSRVRLALGLNGMLVEDARISRAGARFWAWRSSADPHHSLGHPINGMQAERDASK